MCKNQSCVNQKEGAYFNKYALHRNVYFVNTMEWKTSVESKEEYRKIEINWFSP